MPKLKSILIVLLLISLTAMTAYAAQQKFLSVQVRSGAVRAKPSFLGKIVAQLNYGDRVEILSTQGAWSQVGGSRLSGSGWMHASALTDKKIVLKAGAADVNKAASSDELTLAGRGFNQQIESDFKSQNPDIDFTWINRMEKINVSQSQIQMFMLEGALFPEVGK